MSVVVNVMSPPPALYNLSARTVVKLCSLGVFTLRVSLVSWIVMISACVSWISSLSSSSLFLIPFMLTCSMMWWSYLTFTAGYVWLCGLCRHVVVLGPICEVVFVPMWMRWSWCMYCCLCGMCCMFETCVGNRNAGVGDGWLWRVRGVSVCCRINYSHVCEWWRITSSCKELKSKF